MASSVSSDSNADYDSDSTCGSSDTDDKDPDSYDSGNSSNADNTGDDGEESEEESDDDDDSRSGEKLENVVWCGPKKTIPVLIFRPECNFVKVKRLYSTGEKHHLAYKIVRTDCRVIRQLLHKHGFHEVHPNSSDFNLMWIGSHVKPYTLRTFNDFQKVNHFPRSYEITRKDRLYKNFQRMQHAKSSRHFDFLPQTFCLPSEYDDLVAAHNKERGTWIVKPVASSRGRGIFLVNSPQNVPLDAAYVVCRYLNNPLLIDGFKFDLRLYVAVTSYDPLRIYLYEEGLTRFATVQYNTNNKTIKNQCMHLTNYSVNKKSRDYVKCDDGDIEDYGNKWSLGAMLRYLKKQGKDAKLLLSRIEEVINKTIICAELPVATACKMFLPNRGNCFELYGFDILVDANLKPWVLEVNLSPSLACDAPIDLKIKSNMCGDLFSLTGFVVQDPVMRRMQQSKRNQDLASSSTLRQQKERIGSAFSRQRPSSAGTGGNKANRPSSGRKSAAAGPRDANGLNLEERKIVLESKEEYARRGGWMRTFPSPNSMDKYGSFIENRNSYNQMLHSRLFSEKKLSHSLMQEMQERELEEHLAQLLRKLSTRDNSVDRRNLRNKVRNKFPATKRIATASNPRSELSRDDSHSSREPLAQGKLDTRPPTGQIKTSGQQQDGTQQPSTKLNSTSGYQPPQQQNTPVDAASSNPTCTNQTNGTGHERLQNGDNPSASGGANQPPSGAQSSNGVHGKPPIGPHQGTGGSGGVKAAGPEGTGNQSLGPAQGQGQGTRMILEVQRSKGPTKEEIREMVNVPEILDRGGDLTKLQARNAFANYLLRVQQRLISETSRPPEKSDQADQHDEQMDLVLRFLKRAASNLQQQFKVIVPSRKLPIHDRRRILAKQLVDFVQIYSKETNEMEGKKPKKIIKPHNHHQFEEDEDNIDDNRFSHFVNVASEHELEELLTMYTKQNKSASIFLGTSTPQPKSITEMMAQPTSINSVGQQQGSGRSSHSKHASTTGGTLLHRRTSSIENLHRRSSSVDNLHHHASGGGGSGDAVREITYSTVPASCGVNTNKALQHYYAAADTGVAVAAGDGAHHQASSANPSSSSHPKRPHSTTQSGGEPRHPSSADGAVQVYSSKFSRQRPFSAKVAGEGNYPSSGRPTSAVVYRDSSGGQIAARHFSESSQQAIQEALQRLAQRQAARQYSSHSTQNKNLLTQKYVEQHFGMVNPPQGPPGTHTGGHVVAGVGTNPVLTSTLGRSGSRSRSSSVHTRSPSQNSLSAVAGESIHQGGGVLLGRSANSSRLGTTVINEKVRSGGSQEHSHSGHVRRSSHSGIPINRTPSFTTTDTSSRDSSDVGGPANTNVAKRTAAQGAGLGMGNGLSADDAYNSQIKSLQNLSISNRTPKATAVTSHQPDSRAVGSTGGNRQTAGSGLPGPLSLQEQQLMAYELSQQSKAKHLEKIAQAHINDSALRDALHRNAAANVNNASSSAAAAPSSSSSSNPNKVPRPPPQSANIRKPISTQRLARTAQAEDGPKSSSSFYTSLKYNNITGDISRNDKPFNNSGLIQAQVIRH